MLTKALKNAGQPERLATHLHNSSLRRRTVIAMAPKASITDKQIVVVGANRGIGYEVSTEPGTLQTLACLGRDCKAKGM